MDYKIVIPSKGRFDSINKKTMKVLSTYDIDFEKVYVFVIEEEFDKYKEVLPAAVNIVIGVDGINKQRDFIGSYFVDGQPLVSLDDDISALYRLDKETGDKNNKLESIDTLILDTFNKLKKYELNLASVYPVNNFYFMRNKETTDLRFCMGAFRIYFNKKHLEKRKFYYLEDYETTIKYYLNDGGVLRLNNISCDVSYKSGGGGIGKRNIADKKKEVKRFVDKYTPYAKDKKEGEEVMLKKTPKPLTLTALWIGENINPIVEIAWLSWIKQGYNINAYVSNIDKENLNDTLKKFINKKLFFKNALKIMEFKNDDEILPLSDLWRYKLLYEKGGIWVDSDMILLDQLPNDDCIITSEHTKKTGGRAAKLDYKPNIGILKFNKGDELLGKTIKRIEKYMIIDKPQFTDNMKFFQAELKKKEDYNKHILMPYMTCPIPYWNFKEIYMPINDYSVKYGVALPNLNEILDKSIAVHCWENYSIGNKLDIKGCDNKSLFGIIRSHLQ